MRWLWRLVILLILAGIWRNLSVPQPKAFIVWPERSNWVRKIQSEMKQLQQLAQDLPTSIEVEVRRLWKGFQPNGQDLEV